MTINMREFREIYYLKRILVEMGIKSSHWCHVEMKR